MFLVIFLAIIFGIVVISAIYVITSSLTPFPFKINPDPISETSAKIAQVVPSKNENDDYDILHFPMSKRSSYMPMYKDKYIRWDFYKSFIDTTDIQSVGMTCDSIEEAKKVIEDHKIWIKPKILNKSEWQTKNHE